MKILLFVGIVICFVVQSFSQTFIPKIGFNLSTVAIEYEYQWQGDHRFEEGITIGLGLEVPLTKKLSFFPEINFTQKGLATVSKGELRGENVPTTETYYTIETQYDLNCFEMPLLFKYSLGKQNNIFITGGPYVSGAFTGRYEMKDSRTKITTGDTEVTTHSDIAYFSASSVPVNYYDYNILIFNRFDWGFVAGGGLIVSKNVVLELRYCHGLTNVIGWNGSVTGSARMFVMTVGIKLSAGKPEL